MIVGLISDTHGLLRPEAMTALAGVTHILHAGDAGSPEILSALHTIAPVTAVRGNVDFGEWADNLPLETSVILSGHAIHMLHIMSELRIDPESHPFAAVVSGHSHKPSIEKRGQVLFINPGSAGPRRFSLPVSIGFLRLADKQPTEAWIKILDV